MDTSIKNRNAAIGLGITTAVLIVILVIGVVMTLQRVKKLQTIGAAVSSAASNQTECDLGKVPCSFDTDPTVLPPPVAPTSGAFNLAAAQYAAQVVGTLEAASLDYAYPSPPAGATIVSVFSGVNTNTNPNKPSQNKNVNIGWVLSAQGGKQLWIGYRGTQTAPEWQEDMEVQQVQLMEVKGMKGKPVLVHSGFYNAYKEVRSTVRKIVSDAVAVDPSITVYVSGHSLGAAIATLCMADFAAAPIANLQDVRGYVFAPPRVGNSAFVSMLLGAAAGPVVRELHFIANDADIVPTLPLAVHPNFKDTSKPLLYTQFPLLRFTDDWGSWVLNHTMPIYVTNLTKLTAPVVVPVTEADKMKSQRRAVKGGSTRNRDLDSGASHMFHKNMFLNA